MDDIENKRTAEDLKLYQNLPLSIKIRMTRQRINEWVKVFGIDGVYLTWSGGKDSTVLRHIIMQDYPEIESVFVNTGLEYPEIQQFVKAAKDRGENVTILRPKMRFDEVIKKYGYPVIGKEVANTVYEARRSIEKGNTDTWRCQRLFGVGQFKKGSRYNHEKYKPLLDVDFMVSDRCCNVMKKAPAKNFEKETGKKARFMATLAEESNLRSTMWKRYGCNAFEAKKPFSTPMSFWTEQDVLLYIKQYNVEIASVYGEVQYEHDPYQTRIEDYAGFDSGCDKLCTTGAERTGCIFCAFGAHLEKGETRFQRLKETHPRQYEYCIGGGEYNDDGIWQPNKKGLGMGHVFDELNSLYGDDFIRYK